MRRAATPVSPKAAVGSTRLFYRLLSGALRILLFTPVSGRSYNFTVANSENLTGRLLALDLRSDFGQKEYVDHDRSSGRWEYNDCCYFQPRVNVELHAKYPIQTTL